MDMEEAMAFATPSDEHQLLTALAGEWQVALMINMEMKPGGQMIPSNGSGTITSILGGRFIQVETTTETMGMPGSTLQLMGFDRRFGTYFLFGIDEYGTYYALAEGTYDPETKELRLSGADRWPVRDGSVMTSAYQMIFSFESPNSYSYSIQYTADDGTLFEAVKGTAVRK